MFEKKTVYHSQLSSAGKLWVNVQGDIRQGDRSPYVPVRIRGSNQDHLINIDNDLVKDALAKLTPGVWYELEFGGSRDNAYVNVTAMDAPVDDSGSLGALMQEAVREAQRIVDETFTEATHEDVRTLAVTLFLEARRDRSSVISARAREAAPAPVSTPAKAKAETFDADTFLNTPLDSGKHKGLSWNKIIELEPDYVEWAVSKMKKLATRERKALSDALEAAKDPFAPTGESLFP